MFLGLVFGDTWPKRIFGVVVGLGIVALALLNGPEEVAARKARRIRETRRRRTQRSDD